MREFILQNKAEEQKGKTSNVDMWPLHKLTHTNTQQGRQGVKKWGDKPEHNEMVKRQDARH